MHFHRPRSLALVGSAVIALVAACSSSSSSPDAGATGGATCSAPGKATAGPADTHCQGQPAQPVTEASCHPDAATAAMKHRIAADAGDDGGTGTDDAAAGDDAGSSGDDAGASDACDYGTTMFGNSGVDDDCKYKVVWSSDPICEGAAGVNFTVTVTSNVDGSPVSGIPDGVNPEVFIPKSLTAACDDQSSHGSPGTANLLETGAGTGVYKGPIVFDAPGQWTVRFHIHEECADLLDDSPHGHAAFRVTVP